MTMSAMFNPTGATFTARVQPFTDAFAAVTGLAVVIAGDMTFHGTDTQSFRDLAAALVRAADLADEITAQNIAEQVA
jgi:hypothetical protein